MLPSMDEFRITRMQIDRINALLSGLEGELRTDAPPSQQTIDRIRNAATSVWTILSQLPQAD